MSFVPFFLGVCVCAEFELLCSFVSRRKMCKRFPSCVKFKRLNTTTEHRQCSHIHAKQKKKYLSILKKSIEQKAEKKKTSKRFLSLCFEIKFIFLDKVFFIRWVISCAWHFIIIDHYMPLFSCTFAQNRWTLVVNKE